MDNLLANELFLQKLDSEPEKVADTASNYIRNRLRETSFSRKIMTPEYVTKADCQRSVNHDQLVKIVDIEPNSKALSMNFRGLPDSRYVMGTRYEIPFYMVSSEEFQKQEEELLAYEMPITDVIERNSVLDIEAIEDQTFINRCFTAATVAGKNTAYTGAGTWSATALGPTCFSSMFNKFMNPYGTAGSASGVPGAGAGNTPVTTYTNMPTTTGTFAHNFEPRRYEVDTILMNQADFNFMMDWPATSVGNDFATNVVINGFKYTTIFGKKFVSTMKGDLVPPGSLYIFARKEFMGHAYILGDTKFWIEKRKNIITWSAYEIIGMGIGNAYGVGRYYVTA